MRLAIGSSRSRLQCTQMSGYMSSSVHVALDVGREIREKKRENVRGREVHETIEMVQL